MAANNMVSYVSLIKIITTTRLNEAERDLEIIQLTIFDKTKGVFL
jgi:predicted DNA-binding transcriptional regulator